MTTVPDFISPPGDTIADLLDDLGITPTELADRLGYTLESVKLLLEGKASITREVALKLEILGSTAEFWLRREAIYQTELVRHGVEVDCQPLVAQGVEEWRPIPGYEGYYSASSRGRIRGEARKCPRKDGKYNQCYQSVRFQTIDKNGYRLVTLRKDGVGRNLLVSRLVALTFIPNPENKPSVHHLDFDRFNNRVDNLAWATQKEIVDKCRERGTFVHRTNKKTPDDVETMRDLFNLRIPRSKIAEFLDCRFETVRKYTKDLRLPQRVSPAKGVKSKSVSIRKRGKK